MTPSCWINTAIAVGAASETIASDGGNNTATTTASDFGDAFATAGGTNLVISSDNTARAGPTATVGAQGGGETVIEGCG